MEHLGSHRDGAHLLDNDESDPVCASFGAHLALVRVSCLDVPYQHLYPHHSHVNADELYPVAGTHWSEDALAHLATLSQCVRRTSFLSWIRSIHPLLAFECVAVLPPSVMAFLSSSVLSALSQLAENNGFWYLSCVGWIFYFLALATQLD